MATKKTTSKPAAKKTTKSVAKPAAKKTASKPVAKKTVAKPATRVTTKPAAKQELKDVEVSILVVMAVESVILLVGYLILMYYIS